MSKLNTVAVCHEINNRVIIYRNSALEIKDKYLCAICQYVASSLIIQNIKYQILARHRLMGINDVISFVGVCNSVPHYSFENNCIKGLLIMKISLFKNIKCYM